MIKLYFCHVGQAAFAHQHAGKRGKHANRRNSGQEKAPGFGVFIVYKSFRYGLEA